MVQRKKRIKETHTQKKNACHGDRKGGRRKTGGEGAWREVDTGEKMGAYNKIINNFIVHGGSNSVHKP